MVLNVDKVTKSFGTRVLFSDVSFRINERDRYALVGPNGAGKTTLMNIIAGLESADSGHVVFARDARPGYLEQESIEMEGLGVLEEVMTSVADVAELGKRLEALEREMEAADGARAEELLAEYGRLRTRFEAKDGYNIESQARRVLFGLGFHEEDMERSTDEFSVAGRCASRFPSCCCAPPRSFCSTSPPTILTSRACVGSKTSSRAIAAPCSS